MNLSAITYENGFYYDISECLVNHNDMHIVRCKQKTNELKDFIWPNGAVLMESKVRDQEWIHEPWLCTDEVIRIYLAEWVLEQIHEWEEKDEDYFNQKQNGITCE